MAFIWTSHSIRAGPRHEVSGYRTPRMALGGPPPRCWPPTACLSRRPPFLLGLADRPNTGPVSLGDRGMRILGDDAHNAGGTLAATLDSLAVFSDDIYVIDDRILMTPP